MYSRFLPEAGTTNNSLFLFAEEGGSSSANLFLEDFSLRLAGWLEMTIFKKTRNGIIRSFKMAAEGNVYEKDFSTPFGRSK